LLYSFSGKRVNEFSVDHYIIFLRQTKLTGVELSVNNHKTAVNATDDVSCLKENVISKDAADSVNVLTENINLCLEKNNSKTNNNHRTEDAPLEEDFHNKEILDCVVLAALDKTFPADNVFKETLIFVNDKYIVPDLSNDLYFMGITKIWEYTCYTQEKVRNLNLNQKEKVQTKNVFKENFKQERKKNFGAFIIATERASRGIDLPTVTRVVNLHVPVSLESYIHRSGRVGRLCSVAKSNTPSFKKGKVFNIVRSLDDFIVLRKYEKELNINFKITCLNI
jgi:superfamily II DNA/RNA helicase